jgi:hypothetical protein
MNTRALHLRGRRATSRAQALVELALVMPLLVGLVAVLFQFGILFVSYLSLVHATRDIARFVAVHPDTIDGAPTPPTPPCSAAYTPPSASLWQHICANDVPTVIDRNRIMDLPIASPACVSADVNGHCTARTTGSAITINMSYDASSTVFLPTNFQLGPWLKFTVPSSLLTMTYDYTVMVEPH